MYRQIRGIPLDLHYFSDEFFDYPTGLCMNQFWSTPLNHTEKDAVRRYVASGAEITGLRELYNPFGTVMGNSCSNSLDTLTRSLGAAVEKSVTGNVLVRHYVTRSFLSDDTQSRAVGRIYVLGSFASFTTSEHVKPGYGSLEVRVAVPFGKGRGMFLPAPDNVADGPEFLIPPGSTFRIVSVTRRTICAEIVRSLKRAWCTGTDKSRKESRPGPGNGFGITPSRPRGSRDSVRSCRGTRKR